MSDFISDAQTYTTSYQETGRESDGLLRIQWRNGVPATQTPGHFFVEVDRLEALGLDAPSEPWKPFTAVFASGDTAEGYRCDAAKLQVIGVRQQDATRDADGRLAFLAQRADRANRPQGWTVVVELLCGIKGFTVPVVVRSRTIKTSMALLIDICGGMRDLRRDAGKLAGRTLPPWFFYAPVTGAKDAKGKTVYEKTQGAMVTPPRLLLPAGEGRELYNALYVGRELVQWGEQVYQERVEWLREPIGAIEAAHEVAAPSGKNVPQPLEEDEGPHPF
jgi:hypothetical protein